MSSFFLSQDAFAGGFTYLSNSPRCLPQNGSSVMHDSCTILHFFPPCSTSMLNIMTDFASQLLGVSSILGSRSIHELHKRTHIRDEVYPWAPPTLAIHSQSISHRHLQGGNHACYIWKQETVTERNLRKWLMEKIWRDQHVLHDHMKIMPTHEIQLWNIRYHIGNVYHERECISSFIMNVFMDAFTF